MNANNTLRFALYTMLLSLALLGALAWATGPVWAADPGGAALSSISGAVSTTSDSTPLAGVTVRAGASYTAATNGAGAYTIANVPDGGYVVAPVKVGYTFTPTSYMVNVPPNAPQKNFSATMTIMSGRVLASGAGLSGVTIQAGAWQATTDAGGYYTFTEAPAGGYALIPIKVGFGFTPTLYNVTVPPSVRNKDFSGTVIYVAGRVVDTLAEPIPAVTVHAGNAASATTDAGGYYTITQATGSSQSVWAGKVGYVFTPASYQIMMPPAATGKDFVGQKGFTQTLYLPAILKAYK